MNKPNLTKPTCAIIPGFGEKTGDQAYRKTRRLLEKFGWRVMPIDINWSRTTMTGWLRQAETAIAATGRPKMIFGFSVGAMISLLLAARGDFAAVVAASPSPFFKERLHTMPPIAEKILGKRRMRDYEKYSLKEIKKVRSRHVEILAGTDDFPPLIATVKILRRMVPTGATLTMIPDAPHDLGDERYLKAVKKVLARMER